ncbi:MAG: hypothetical protein HKN41_04600, partial [Ilumatobacter sp.]|nr:hypothetical protein [Ilumatobacter sp.]
QCATTTRSGTPTREDGRDMGLPDWWTRTRCGLMFQANLASVPAWAPIGEYAGWYRAHVDGGTRDVLLHPSPLVETLAHHRDRWDHVDSYADFLPFLTFDEFDADAWTSLARDLGAGYAVMVAKHHDGLCWWDAPGSQLTVMGDGPKRNVLAEFSAACERAGLVFGTQYSLLDWTDARYPGRAYVDDVVHPQVLDLVRRFGSRMLWGDGHWGAGGDHWRSDDLLGAARAHDSDVVVNDRWWAAHADVRTFEYQMPPDIVHSPWELRRGLGGGLGYNRAERAEHLLDANGIVSLLTEVVAKGGHLLLCIGPDATGAIPDVVQERLRAAGGWIRRHAELISDGQPWRHWGDEGCRYLDVNGIVHVVDVGGGGRFPHLLPDVARVTAIESLDGAPMRFEQGSDGVQLERRPRHRDRLPTVYRVELEEPPEPPIELFARTAPEPIPLAPLLADAAPGTVVQLGDGTYVGPADVPSAVTLRGLGPDRTRIVGTPPSAPGSRRQAPITLQSRARIEHCHLERPEERIAWLPLPVVELVGEGTSMVGCHVAGHVAVSGDQARIVSCEAGGVVVSGADAAEICRSTFVGMQWDCAVDLDGGAGHVVEGCDVHDALQALRLTGTVEASVRGNRIRARWWGVQLVDTEGTEVIGNSMTATMRAVDVDGGTLTRVTSNAVIDGDTGCIVQRGASDVEITGNHWQGCRVGLLTWDAGRVRQRDNTTVDAGEADVVNGP